MDIECKEKHTKYDPTMEEFKCPSCGAEASVFYIEDGPNMDCQKLHDTDTLCCMGTGKDGQPCLYSTSGKAFVARLLKKKNMVPCEHCKGKGFVKGKD